VALIDATVDLGPARDLLADMQREMPGILEDAVLAVALEVEGELKRSAAQRLDKDPTGDLVRSIRTVDRQGGVKVVGSDRPYARIQDVGGPIRPTTGRYLAIPIDQPKSLRGKWPRDYARGELYFVQAKDGRAYLFHAPSGRLEFKLQESVTIRGTRWFTDVVDRMPQIAGEVVVAVVEDRLRALT
jgi:hypothetical protein